jgi:hypothetical protein
VEGGDHGLEIPHGLHRSLSALSDLVEMILNFAF